jgi:two-component system, sensor histidine kinase LadS
MKTHRLSNLVFACFMFASFQVHFIFNVSGMIMRGFIAFCLLLTVSYGQAQSIIEIDDNIDERNFMPHEIPMFVDVADELSFWEISSKAYSNRFVTNALYQNKDFTANASYWIRLPIHHNPGTRKIWLLEFYDQTIDYLEAFIPQEDGSFRNVIMGDEKPFSQRLIPHKNFEIPLNIKSDTTLYYYFKVRSHEFADIRIALRSTNWFTYYALNEYFLFGTFYGMILIIILYNLLVFIAIKEIKNVYYIIYLLSVAAYAVSLDGIGFQYLWPSHPEWNEYATGLTLYSVIISSLVFTRRFLRTKAIAPALDRLFIVMIVIRTLWFTTALSFLPQYLPYRVPDIIPLSLIFYTGIFVWRKGYRPARFFVIAYGVLFAGFFLRTLVYFNVLRFTTLSHYSLHISFVLEMLLLTFALGDRIRILKAMRDRALKRIIQQHEVNMRLKDKVNRELEQKVEERTLQLHEKNHQLEEINKKLEMQAFEINQINSILDLDNWKLKNSIKEVLNERLMEKMMDYKQFSTLYPDTLACHRFLEEVKWQVNYTCRKCANTKFFAGAQKFARRCTRCGYNESVTAFTIFHSIKFPIEKAFYIAYVVVAGKDDSTLERLAGDLDIGVSTVWSFKHKVLERLLHFDRKGNRPSASRWEEIILLPDHQKSSSRPSGTATVARVVEKK